MVHTIGPKTGLNPRGCLSSVGGSPRSAPAHFHEGGSAPSTEKSSELAPEILGFQAQSISGPSTTAGPYNPSHKCLESPKPNSDRLAFVVQLPDCSSERSRWREALLTLT